MHVYCSVLQILGAWGNCNVKLFQNKITVDTHDAALICLEQVPPFSHGLGSQTLISHKDP